MKLCRWESKDLPRGSFESSNLFPRLIYNKTTFLGLNALRLYKSSNDDTKVLGETGKDFPNQNECKKLKKLELPSLMRIAFLI